MRTTTDLEAHHIIRQEYFGLDFDEMQKLRRLSEPDENGFTVLPKFENLSKLDPPEVYNEALRLHDMEGMNKKAEAWADHLKTMSPRELNPWYVDKERYLNQHADQITGADLLHESYVKLATNAQAAGPDAIPLIKALEDTGLKDRALNTIEGSAALRKQVELLQANGKITATTAPDIYHQLKNQYIPRADYEQLTKFGKPWVVPEALQGVVNLWDSLTNLTKAGLTAIWPAKYVRDAVTGSYQNVVHGAFGGRAYIDAMRLHGMGGSLLGGPEGIDLASYGAKDLGELQNRLAQRNIGVSGGAAREVIGQDTPLEQLTKRLPGTNPTGLMDLLGGKLPEGTTIKPWDIGGFGGRTETKFAPAAVGYKVGNKIFDVNETAAFLKKVRDGFTDEAAAQVAKEAQFKWGARSLTGFEKNVMRRAIPFYSWIQANVPAQIRQLYERPGGVVAQSIRTEGELRSKPGEFIPEYLESGAAIPVGKEDSGKQRFLTSVGLPYQDLADFVGRGETTQQRLASVGQGLLGQTNPLIKGPLEEATGKQFYTGRDLADLYSRTGLPQPGEQILMNSPLSRFITTGSTLADERKGLGAKALNLFSGFKLSDVDMDKQRNIEAQDLMDELLRGKPEVGNIQRFYAKPGAQLSKDEMELLRLQATLEKEFRERKKKGAG